MIAAIIDDTLYLQDAVAAVTSRSAGALVTFEGVVRDHSRDLSGQTRDVDYLEYEAYRPMAKREMERVIAEVEARWEVSCAASHRVGKLAIGETAVIIAVASSHRNEAFEACRYAIDRIKETVPIWKKEVAKDGFWWVENPVEKVAEVSAEKVGAEKVGAEKVGAEKVGAGKIVKDEPAQNVTSTPAVEKQSAGWKGF